MFQTIPSFTKCITISRLNFRTKCSFVMNFRSFLKLYFRNKMGSWIRTLCCLSSPAEVVRGYPISGKAMRRNSVCQSVGPFISTWIVDLRASIHFFVRRQIPNHHERRPLSRQGHGWWQARLIVPIDRRSKSAWISRIFCTIGLHELKLSFPKVENQCVP